jgi:uncharacterized protein (DUF58 family)
VTAARLQQQAERVAAGLPALLLKARTLAYSVNAGSHGRKRPGSGDDFWQFRHSQPGDPLTAIDWRQSGKSDHLYIRETEWTIAHTTRIWVDPSASMRWRSESVPESKFARACLLAVALTSLLEQAGERIGLLDRPGPAFFGRTAPTRMAHALWTAPLSDMLPSQPIGSRSGLVLLSDFLHPLPLLAEQLGRWSASGLSGHLLQILDPAEESLHFTGRVRLRGLEQEGEMLLPDAQSLQQPYQRAVADHRRGLQALAQQFGWQFGLHHSDQPARAGLIHLHAALSRN